MYYLYDQVVCNNKIISLYHKYRQLQKRETLDGLISRAIGVPCNQDGRIQILEDLNYVMTFDYAMKMLTIHERRMCGIPVLIRGETGVGKTFLLETLSSLWNHALQANLDLEKDRLRDVLREDVRILFGKSKIEEAKSEKIDQAIKALSMEEELSQPIISFIIEETVNKTFQQEVPLKIIKEHYLTNLLILKNNPVFFILQVPQTKDISSCGSFIELFKNVEKCKSYNEVWLSVQQHA